MGPSTKAAMDPGEMARTAVQDSPARPSDDSSVGATSRGNEPDDGIDQLVTEHRALERLFDELGRPSGSAWERKGRIIRICQAISEHEDVEASVLAPLIRSRLNDGHHLWRSLRRRYRTIDKLLAEIERRSISSPDLPELLERAMTAVDELIEEQESSTFARIRSTLSRGELEKLDDQVTAAHRHADTRPHRYLPRRGALARKARTGMAVVDKLRDRETPRL